MAAPRGPPVAAQAVMLGFGLLENLQRRCAAIPDTLQLAGGLPHEALFPRAALAEAFERVVARPGCTAFQYGWPEGNAQLREWIARRLRKRGADVRDDDVIITNGAQQAIALAVEQLSSSGRRAAVDPETYPGALQLFSNHGVVPVVGRGEADWIYAMPGVANPRGTGLEPPQRDAIVGTGHPIIADEAYAELRFDGRLERPLLADARDRVWHVGTFSKVLCPGLRVGWLVPPRTVLGAVLRAKRARDLQAGSLSQAVLATFLESDDFESRLARTRSFYARRAARLAAALARHLPSWTFTAPEGGFSVFVETDLEGHPATALVQAVRLGVSFDPGILFRANGERSRRLTMRLCHSSVSDEQDLEVAVCRLARLAGVRLE